MITRRYTLSLWRDDMGTFTQPGCRNAEDAFWHVNSARDHDGLRHLTKEKFVDMLKHPNNSTANAKLIEE